MATNMVRNNAEDILKEATKRLKNKEDKIMRDTFGNRMCYYNALEADDNGMIVCMVVENTAGYRPMTGRDAREVYDNEFESTRRWENGGEEEK